MKRSILILAVLFVIAGFLDWIVCNKINKANKIKAEDIYQIIEDDDGNHFEEPYKIEGKYLRFEKNCKTIHFIDYGLFNLSDLTANYSDAVSPKEIMIRENGISRPYFLFDNLKTDFYILTFVSHNYKKTTSYISNSFSASSNSSSVYGLPFIFLITFFLELRKLRSITTSFSSFEFDLGLHQNS